MYASAIEIAARFTRPIHSLARNYGSSRITPGTATLFFVNDDGYALTCRHVAQQLMAASDINAKYQSFREELTALPADKSHRQRQRELERKFGFDKHATAELHNRFVNCVTGTLSLQAIASEKYDLALLKFSGFEQLLCREFPVFPKDASNLAPGKFLCRLGFPFPEFTNFEFDEASATCRWTETGRAQSPQFPFEGMVTRHVLDAEGRIFGFEMSTPGLRGQSGGPAFDTDGKIWGMQSATLHLDLDFDVNQEVIRGGTQKRVTDSAFLHVGRCIGADALKDFMHQHQVRFCEE